MRCAPRLLFSGSCNEAGGESASRHIAGIALIAAGIPYIRGGQTKTSEVPTHGFIEAHRFSSLSLLARNRVVCAVALDRNRRFGSCTKHGNDLPGRPEPKPLRYRPNTSDGVPRSERPLLHCWRLHPGRWPHAGICRCGQRQHRSPRHQLRSGRCRRQHRGQHHCPLPRRQRPLHRWHLPDGQRRVTFTPRQDRFPQRPARRVMEPRF